MQLRADSTGTVIYSAHAGWRGQRINLLANMMLSQADQETFYNSGVCYTPTVAWCRRAGSCPRPASPVPYACLRVRLGTLDQGLGGTGQ